MKISYIVSAKNAERFLEDCVKSIVTQELPSDCSYELLIGVDDCPKTLEKALSLTGLGNVRVFEMLSHVGTYVTANTLVANSGGDWIFRVDADDVCAKGRTLAMIQRARRTGARMVNTYFAEMTIDGRRLVDKRKPADGVWAYERSLWSEIGGWENWACSSDSLLKIKALAHVGEKGATVVGKHMYLRRMHPGQLTQHPVLGKQTPERERFRKRIAAEMARLDNGGELIRTTPVYGPFIEHTGKGEIEYVADDTLVTPPVFTVQREDVTVSLCSIPSREDYLRRVVTSLSAQAKRVNVYLNNYTAVPEWLSAFDNATVATSQEHGDLGDRGKFFWADEVEGYHFTCDDDIDYPEDYVHRTLEEFERLGKHVVLTYHGRELPRRPSKYYKGERHYFHFAHTCNQNYVNVCGTGVLAYHTDTIKVKFADFKEPNMADIWFALQAQKQRIVCICLPHKRSWLKPLPTASNIYDASFKNLDTAMNTGQRQDEIVVNYGKRKGWMIHA
jgi:glycosyltransferase involved in cell wall biosynthesis